MDPVVPLTPSPAAVRDGERTRPQPPPVSYPDLRGWLGLVILAVVAALFVEATKRVLLSFAIIFLLAMVLNPLVALLQRRGWPRGAAVGLLVAVALGLFGLAVWLVAPPFLDQVNELLHRAPDLARRVRDQLQGYVQRYPAIQQALPTADQIAGMFGPRAGALAGVVVRSTFGLVGGLLGLVFSVLLLLFVLGDPKPLVARYLELMPDRHRDPARRTLVRLMQQMAAWARGVLINGVAAGVTTGLLLSLIGVHPALVFGVLTFLGEFVPIVGSVVMALPALFVALSQGPEKFGLALLAILFVQQVEANLLIPFVLGKSMDLNPVSIFFFTLTMGSLFGLPGAVLAVPAAALCKIVVDEFYLRPRRLNRTAIERDAEAIIRNEVKVEA